MCNTANRIVNLSQWQLKAIIAKETVRLHVMWISKTSSSGAVVSE